MKRVSATRTKKAKKGKRKAVRAKKVKKRAAKVKKKAARAKPGTKKQSKSFIGMIKGRLKKK